MPRDTPAAGRRVGRRRLGDVDVAFAKTAGIEGEDATALAALRKLPAAELVRGLNLMTMGQQRDT